MSMGQQPGLVVADRYRLERKLGEGGMGSVWAATHTLTRGSVALKFLKPEALSNQAAVRRFMREARAAAAVNHPNVIQVHDVFQMEDGAPVMVMDLLHGESLGEKLAREGRIALTELARIMVPVVSAVGSAHAAGIVHRDLKPDNIFLARSPEGALVPKVLDFGIAKLNALTPEATQSAELTRTGALLGTPYYMSPEQVFGEKDVDARSDVWAVGVILYEALTGQRPIDGDNLGQLLKVITLGQIRPIESVSPELPADVCGLVSHMLVTDREQRLPGLHRAFEVLKGYTTELAQSFSEVRDFSAELGEATGTGRRELASHPVDAAFAKTEHGAAGTAEASITADAFAHTDAGTPSPPMHRFPTRALALGAVAVVFVSGSLFTWLRATPAASPAASAVESTDVAAALLPAASAELVPAETSVHAAASAPPSSVAPDTSAAPPPSGRRKGAPLGAAKPVASAKPAASAKPVTSAKPATSAATSPANKQEGSLGGVATAAPF